MVSSDESLHDSYKVRLEMIEEFIKFKREQMNDEGYICRSGQIKNQNKFSEEV